MPVADAFLPESELFRQLRKEPGGSEWLAALPAVVAELEERWGITTGTPFGGGSAGWVAPVSMKDGRAAVLKVSWPHVEARAEAAALMHWSGRGCVTVFEYQHDRWAILMERCVPGTTLGTGAVNPEDALTNAALVLRRLHSVRAPLTGPIADVGAMTRGWANLVRERNSGLSPGYDPGLVELGAHLLETLPDKSEMPVLLHGDFNPGNILSSDRQGWAAIDPKPMIGDPCYDPAPLLLQVDPPLRLPHPEQVLRDRVDLVARIMEVPADRVLAWIAARSVEWALWYVSRGGIEAGRDEMRTARTAADLAGL